MEFIPPPPPPLPASFIKRAQDESTECKLSTKVGDNLLILDALKIWAEFHEKTRGTFLASWTNSSTILQQGPQCGLVALAMASQSCGLEIDTHTVFQQALAMGITKRGEIFSSTALCTLATHMKIDATLLNDGFNDVQVLLRILLSGKKLLVPYDADCNHSPCLKNGHKAHWALIVGVLFELDRNLIDQKHCCSWERIRENLYQFCDVRTIDDVPINMVNSTDVYFLAKQGKSKRLAIWSYKSLQESNNNLEEVDPKRNNNLEFVLPPDNKLTDLRGKVIIVG